MSHCARYLHVDNLLLTFSLIWLTAVHLATEGGNTSAKGVNTYNELTLQAKQNKLILNSNRYRNIVRG